jgi:transporter family protein
MKDLKKPLLLKKDKGIKVKNSGSLNPLISKVGGVDHSIHFPGLSVPKWIFYSLLTVFLYGLQGLSIKLSSNNIPPLLIQVISSFGLIPVIFVLLFSRNIRAIHGKLGNGIWFSILVGITGLIAALAQFYASSLGGPASIVVPVISLSSLVTVIFARFVYKDRLNLFQIIGVSLSIIAILMFNIKGDDFSGTSWSFWDIVPSTWMLIALGGLLSAGIAGLFIKSATNNVSADLVTLVVLTVNLSFSVILIFSQSFSWDISLRDMIVCFLVGLFGSTAFLTQSAAYSYGITSLVAPLCSLFPVVTVILSAPVLGEKLTLMIIGAVAISTLAGITISIEKKPKL